jgi:hypothetical protein
MRCDAFEALVVDLARERLADEGTREEALAHTAHCTSCDAQLRREQMVSQALRALAEATAEAEPPERIEHALRAAWRTARPARQRPRPHARPWLWSGLAAAALLVIVLGIHYDDRSGAPAAAASASPDQAQAQTDSARFIPLRWGEPLAEEDGLRVVRVVMEPSSLAALAIPVCGGESPSGPILADLALGYDGVARAIRIVR